MEFGIPPRNEQVSGFLLQKQPPPLRARGNLNYPQFIKLVQHLWEEAHPDIPLRPVQADKYARYPVIVYGLEMRKTVQNEPKMRHRETVYRQDGNTIISGQRFQNVITFTVITEHNPELCEAIIETFEDFMLEYTPIFKELGVSEFLYTRRLPDRDRTRPDEDNDERSVAYLVTLEKVLVKEVAILQKILVSARTMLDSFWEGTEFWVFDPENPDGPSNYLYCPEHPFKIGDLVVIWPPNDIQDNTANGTADYIIDRDVPKGLYTDYIYQVYAVSEDRIYLKNLAGSEAIAYKHGMGRLTGAELAGAYVQGEYVDEFKSVAPATPSY